MTKSKDEKEKEYKQTLFDWFLLALFIALVIALLLLGLWIWRLTGKNEAFGGGMVGGLGGVLLLWVVGKLPNAKLRRRIKENDFAFENGCWFVVQEANDGSRRRVGVPWAEQKDAVDDLEAYRKDGYKNLHIGGGVCMDFDKQHETMGIPTKE